MNEIETEMSLFEMIKLDGSKLESIVFSLRLNNQGHGFLDHHHNHYV